MPRFDFPLRSAALALAGMAAVVAAGAKLHLLALAQGGAPPSTLDLGYTVGVAVVVWVACATALFALGDAETRRTAALEALGRRVAALDDPTDAAVNRLLAEAANRLGETAEVFRPAATAAREARAKAAEARTHAAALLQINPHYVVLCTLDGNIVEANPAFYAVTGLPFEAVRGGRIEVLDDVMPIAPLFELARRSAREGSSLSGIEYALVNRDDVRRNVQISLRAVQVGGKEGVMIQATDVANQRQLEQQISTFSDSLDLMVDQRVAQLTAGQATLRRVLDDAGVVVVTFDGHGGTRRYSRAAEALTGRPAGLVPHFTAFTAAMELPLAQRAAFESWFLGTGAGAFETEGSPLGGPPRRFAWRKAAAGDEGHTDRRVLVGMEMARRVPPPAPPTPPAPPQQMQAGGDGAPAYAAPAPPIPRVDPAPLANPASPGSPPAPQYEPQLRAAEPFQDLPVPDDTDEFYAQAEAAYRASEYLEAMYDAMPLSAGGFDTPFDGGNAGPAPDLP